MEAALAEFQALRVEIISNLNSQAALVGLALTAVGVIVGLTVKEGAGERLLLAIPPLTLFMVLLHIGSSYRLSLIGRYIENDLWPYIAEQVGDTAGLPSWEAKTAARQFSWEALPVAVFLNSPAMAILIVVSIVALIQVDGPEFFSWAGWFSVVAAIVASMVVGYWVRGDSRPEKSKSEQGASTAAEAPTGCCPPGP